MRGAMRRAIALFAMFFAVPLAAAEIEAGGAHVIAIPSDTGELDIATSRGFGAHVEVFWSDRLSTRLAGVFVNPAAILYPENPPPTDVDLGTLGLDIYSATARLHFAHRARLSAFAGGGAALVSVGNLDDRFGDEVEIEFDAETAFVAEAGLRYRVLPRVVFEVSAAYMPLELEAEAPVPPSLAIDPLIVSVGAAWRF
jgi:hypothetical protein